MSPALLVAQGAAQDIRDIRGPIALPEPMPWLLAGALVLLLALLALGARKLLRARKRRALTPYQTATERLRASAGKADLSPADELAEQLSGALREYVEQRFGVGAVHRTSEDFLAKLVRESTKLAAFRPELERFLASCDLAKFAGSALTPEQRAELCQDALGFVHAAEASLLEADPQPLQGAGA